MRRLEHFYDALPRDSARTEEFGSLVLFIAEDSGWPFYARPRPDSPTPPTAADVRAVRARQRDLGLPEAFEWVHENTPELLHIARSAGLSVLEAPLMVLNPADLPAPAELPRVPVRLVDPTAPNFATDIAIRRAVANLGFSAAGTAVGRAGPADRDAHLVPLTPADAEEEQQRAQTGGRLSALAELPGQGALASGTAMRVGDIAEIAGIATLPAARRRGLGAAVTATLARRLVETGCEVVFLSAGSEEIARVYQRVGFHRIGTACIAEPGRVIA
ncbi:MAG TPA: GNAT family N-acetyltransferase [Micromonospora sp.]|nr:GNAT family N-acetyltransferase [Micromonospora sp.]